MEEEKKNNTWIFLIICLIIGICIGVGVTLFVNKNINTNEVKEENKESEVPSNPIIEEKEENNNEPIPVVNEEVTFTESDIDSYIETVPTLLYTYGRNYGDNAYSGKKITFDNISPAVLFNIEFSGYEENNNFNNITTTKINETLKAKYGKELSEFPQTVMVGMNEYLLDGDTYKLNEEFAAGSTGVEKMVNKKEYHMEDGKLVIIEEALFTLSNTVFATDDKTFDIYSNYNDLTSGINRKESIKVSCEDDYCQFDDVSDIIVFKITVPYTRFKHVFENIDGKYYWYSTEVE